MARSIVIVVLTTLVAGSALAGKRARKLPVDAYIKSAKIAIISGDLNRYPDAIAMLDSLFMHYGPHAEALHWMGQINVDYIEKSPSPMDKKPYVDRMVAYFDTLHQCCDNDEIKKKYRKNCKKYIQHADSITVMYWREFYNAGVEQLTVMDEISDEIELAEDSASRSYLEANLQANMDSCVANLELAITIDPTNHQTYIGIGSAYEKTGNHDKALEWQEIGLEKSPDNVKASMSLSIGYTYINMDQYCDAIPHLKNYLADSTTDTTWMYNLSICYNNCGHYDSALAIYGDILQVNPNHSKVLSGVGRYYNELARRSSDSANFYSDKGDESLKQDWLARKDEAFDSSHTYYKRAFQANPDDEFI
ncbi:MAG: tetratricopeptide repeat protein, partial [candidate division Zixibacteria bacterium]|nr:tetratricopeptide repeat protein [candidate division Zixibacteria bacterium]